MSVSIVLHLILVKLSGYNGYHTRNNLKHVGDITFNPWASYQIRKIAGCACAGNAGYVFPRRRIQRKPLVSDPGMPHGTCVTHVPWGMSGSLTCGDGENVPGIPGACAPAILRIWQEVHWRPDFFLSSESVFVSNITKSECIFMTFSVYVGYYTRNYCHKRDVGLAFLCQ